MSYRKVRIFVASPNDVANECQRLHAVADELNRTGQIANQLGLTIEVLDWRTHVAPFVGRPESVVLNQLQTEHWDIFVGILWLRFGTPTGATEPITGKPFTSGTQEEFFIAYKSWEKKGTPKILFYRCTRLPKSLKDINTEQLQSVEAFFSQFQPEAAHPGLVQNYEPEEEFERRVRADLTKILFEYGRDTLHSNTSTTETTTPERMTYELVPYSAVNWDELLDKAETHLRTTGFALIRIVDFNAKKIAAKVRESNTFCASIILSNPLHISAELRLADEGNNILAREDICKITLRLRKYRRELLDPLGLSHRMAIKHIDAYPTIAVAIFDNDLYAYFYPYGSLGTDSPVITFRDYKQNELATFFEKHLAAIEGVAHDPLYEELSKLFTVAPSDSTRTALE